MKNKTKIFVILGVAVFLIAAGVLTFVFWPKDNIKEVYTKAIKDSLGLKKSDSKDDNRYDDKILKMAFEYNDLLEETPKNNKFEFVVDNTKKDATGYILFDMFVEELGKNEQYEMIVEENKVFFTVKDVFEKYYYAEASNEESSNDSTTEVNDDVITNAFEEAFFDVIESGNINKDSKEITINGKKYESTKYSYTFTGNDTYAVIDNAIKKIKEKDKKQYETIVQSIQLDELESLKDLGNLFTYTVYLDDDDNVISANISVNFDFQDQKLNVVFSENQVEGYSRYYISVAGQKLFDLELEKENDKKVELSLSMMGMKMITGELVLESENKMSFSLENTKDLEIDIDIQGTIEVRNDEEVNISVTSIIGEDVKNEMKLIIDVLDEMPKYDVSNSAPMDEMTDEEKELLEKRFGFITQYLQGNSMTPNFD